ncbi:hypothetical protein NXF25_003172 [Crotalus adamanteus]
MPESCWI